ncbi:MAG: hypothetical protein JNM79_24220 [Burkholderiales bacterium]|nr:hypothetical protein [Burkholderiales bacterium]
MSFYAWKPYVPVAKRRAQAEKVAAKAAKAGASLTPVRARGNKIAGTFWGRAWCDNLERYSDFSNRLPRGRTYLRNGSVIDLKIEGGEVKAQVAGSSLYKTVVKVAAVPQTQWREISAECAGSIDSVVELLRGKLSQAVMSRLCKPGTGLFPAPKEISFNCSCPDWASMCKHVAAVLYGVGVRLDEQPELLFRLRNVDAADLVAQASAGLTPRKKRPVPAHVLDDSELADVFGIEIAAGPALPIAGAARKNTVAKTNTKKAARAVGESARKTWTTPAMAEAAKTPPIKASKARPKMDARHNASAPPTPPRRATKASAEPTSAPRKTVARKPVVTHATTKRAVANPKQRVAAKPATARRRKT